MARFSSIARPVVTVIAVAAATLAAAPASAQDPVPEGAGELDGETIPVIVEFEDVPTVDDLAEVGDLGGDRADEPTAIGERVVAADVTAAELDSLAARDDVVSARPARTDLQLMLDRSGPTIGATTLHERGLDGAGRVVAVIDSGVDTAHPALAGSVVAEGCFLDGIGSAAERCAGGGERSGSAAPCTLIAVACTHGTGVAGIVTSDDAVYTGVAPAAGVIALRVTGIMGNSQDGYRTSIPEAGVLAALEHVYALRNTYSIAAVNLSLGGDPGGCRDTVWEDVVARLDAAGIAVVAASGNSGWSDQIAFPACLTGVISVGATDPTGRVASFTSSSPALDLVAPGAPVATTVQSSINPSGFAYQQGTSFAAPHVAAAFALLRRPSGWSVARMRNLLRISGEMAARPVAPTERADRFPEVRLDVAAGFTPFADADYGFWVGAADWAKLTGVSTGIGGNQFAPDAPLTRAQAVTFLWRFMGSPDHDTSSGFGDVDPNSWYGAAVAWAAATGVTTGTSPGVFSPDDVVTRGQLATFMWRTVGQPAGGSAFVFADVAPGAFYAAAVGWMATHGITTGTAPSLFSPEDTVTRAQMVTFEFRLASVKAAWGGPVAAPALALF